MALHFDNGANLNSVWAESSDNAFEEGLDVTMNSEKLRYARLIL